MASVCVPLAPGFEEIEAMSIVDVLRRAGVEVRTAAVTKGGAVPVEGAHGIKVVADTTIDEAVKHGWDMIVLPGGMPGATNLRDDPRVASLLRKVQDGGGWTAAICAAPIALGAAGLLEGREATCYPGFEKELRGAKARTDRVVRSGQVVTSRGPGTALEFALALVEILAGKPKAQELAQGMLVARA
ncbi:MAG: DJ-1/PfpI family protein [Planctomycetes bacterium]|nr:DJ-1/PfpI family protein [Planctomycetota bacterium]